MTKLTEEQIQFLNHHQISLSKVFDATGMKRADYLVAMKRTGSSVAIGVPPCTDPARHTIKNTSGHCAMCNPHHFAFRNRYYEEGDVYVAHSKKINLVKIGTSANTHERMGQINYYGYGGANDWVAKYIKKVNNAARIEFEAQKQIDKNRVWRSYTKDGEIVDCQELFNCDVTIAIESVNQSIAVHSKA